MELNFKDKNVLILAPHTDDGEFGCGGTIARLLEEGSNLTYVAFSTCESSVPEGEPLDILRKELLRAMAWYGIPDENIIILDYPVRLFSQHRQEILDDMIKIGSRVKPEMVFMPSINDVHQDHHTIAEEAMRAFKKTTLMGYEEPWNNFTFKNQAYIKLEERQIKKKLGAIACYETQKMRSYSDEAFIRGLARIHGVQVGCEYAEVFEVIRWIV